MSYVDPATGIPVGRILSRREADEVAANVAAQAEADIAAAREAGFKTVTSGRFVAFKSPRGKLGSWLYSERDALLEAYEYWASGGE